MANKGFDVNQDYYGILGISRDANASEIDQAYAELKQDLLDRAKNALSKSAQEQIQAECDELDEAYDVLSDEDLRAKYDKATTQITVYRGSRIVDEEDAEEIAEEARINWKKIALTAAIIAIIIATLGTGYFIGKNSNKNKGDKVVGTTQSSDIVGGNEDPTQETTQENNNNQENNNINNETPTTVFYGDINDSQLVHERAQVLTSELNNAGIINIGTGIPYSVEEIENIILYMNGAYVPTSEQDVYDMYTEFLNFVTGPLNLETFIYQVNYQAGETSFADIINQNAQNPKTFDLATAATYGNGVGGYYVQWLQDKYFELLYTTNEEDYNRIYSEVWQSYADIMKGNGYTFYVDKSAVTITEQELLQKGNIGVANQITFWLLNFEPFRNTKTQEQYDVVNKYISANPDEQHDTVSIDEMFEYINAVCDINALDNIDEATISQLDQIDYAVDDNGNSLHTMINGVPGQTWGVRLQYNTKAIAQEQLASHTNTLN